MKQNQLDNEYIIYVNDCVGRINPIMPLCFDDWKEQQPPAPVQAVREGMPEKLKVVTFGENSVGVFPDTGKMERSWFNILHYDGMKEFNKTNCREICKRYNAFPGMLEALKELVYVVGHTYKGKPALLKAQAVLDNLK